MKKIITLVAIVAAMAISCSKKVVVPPPPVVMVPSIEQVSFNPGYVSAPQAKVVVLKGKISIGTWKSCHISDIASSGVVVSTIGATAPPVATAYKNSILKITHQGSDIADLRSQNVDERGAVRVNLYKQQTDFNEVEFSYSVDATALALNTKFTAKLEFTIKGYSNDSVKTQVLTVTGPAIEFSVGTLSNVLHTSSPVGKTVESNPIAAVYTVKTQYQGSTLLAAVVKMQHAGSTTGVGLFLDSTTSSPLAVGTFVGDSAVITLTDQILSLGESKNLYVRPMVKSGALGNTNLRTSAAFVYKTDGGQTKRTDFVASKDVLWFKSYIIIEAIPSGTTSIVNNQWITGVKFRAKSVGSIPAMRKLSFKVLAHTDVWNWGGYIWDAQLYVNNSPGQNFRYWVPGNNLIEADNSDEILITNDWKTFEFKIVTEDFLPGDALQVGLIIDQASAPVEYRYLNDGVQNFFTGLYSSPGKNSNADPAAFLWSDRSAQNHSAKTTFSSNDWYNGASVTVSGAVPIETKTMSKGQAPSTGSIQVNSKKPLLRLKAQKIVNH